MNAFASWSGGKDCMFALHTYLKSQEHEIACLVNMCEENDEYSRSHGLKKGIIAAQASCMNIPLIQQHTDVKGYEANLKTVILGLKAQGITAGIFGDIYLKEHRVWIERVCSEMQIEPIFPLWGYDTGQLLKDFISEGFKAITVSIRQDMLPFNWLGRELDTPFLEEISSLPGIDPCAENGEYHTFVYDGPLFAAPVNFTRGIISSKNNHHFLELNYRYAGSH